MPKLWFAILTMCCIYGEVRGLNHLAEHLGMEYRYALRALRSLEMRDPRLKVTHYGRGRKIVIEYQVEGGDYELRLSEKKTLTFSSDRI